MNLPGPRSRRPTWRWVLVGGWVLLTVLAIVLHLWLGDRVAIELLTGTSAIIATLFAASMCRGAAQVERPDRWGWSIFAVALVVNGGAVLVHLGYEIVGDTDPTLSLTDGLILVSKALTIVALLAFPMTFKTRVSAWRSRLEAMLIAVSAAYLGWALALSTRFQGALDAVPAAAFAAGPMADLVAAALALSIGMSRPKSQRHTWTLLGIGLVVLACTDVLVGLINVGGPPTSTHVVYASGVIALSLFVLAARSVHRVEPNPNESPTERSFAMSIVPLAFIGLNLVVTLFVGDRLLTDRLNFAIAMASAVSWLAWQVAVQLENAELNRTLRQEVSRFRTVVDHAPIAIVETDPKGRVQLWNHDAAALFGRTSDEMMGEVPDVLPTDEPGSAGAVRRVLRGDVLHSEPMRLASADGDRLDLLVSAAPMFDDSGAMTSVICLASDDRHRRRIEAALFEAQKFQALGQLAGGIAHDFNNLLAVMLWTTEFLLSSDGHSPDDRVALTEIITAGRRAAELVDQLVTYSRRQVDPFPEMLDLADVLHDVEPMLGRLGGSRVRFHQHVDNDLGDVLVDAAAIERVIVNLVINACEAMPDGGAVHVRGQNVTVAPGTFLSTGSVPAGPYVQLSVQDEGVGVEPEVAPRIFEPFFTTKDRGIGTGLGLSTVEGIVGRAGGYIDVESEIGRGTNIRILLPVPAPDSEPIPRPAPFLPQELVDQTEQGERAEQGEPGGAPEGSPPDTTAKTVLIVEDQAAVRRAAVRILEASGFEVLQAESGAEALDLERRADVTVDLLLSDVLMPGMSGIELAGAFVARNRDRPVILMSGFVADSLDAIEPPAGVVRMLPKPFTAESLLAAVADAITAHPTPPHAPTLVRRT